ncbi:Ig-like domain-containing protein [Bacteroidales bacterium OttesenSCG-928-K03]|nr:Ig-like domain-containing protein [Odoribacter sp. OttesenSCG-928-L07]MDL2239518.1 Ig-like domain-containing protein [Bacteroidales bacterium OttesenSCG-928-L14]MDL2243040.1 Ig-like domain-containing protein [Bacteroidales bacterium OttesenSCG-928-K03]
MKKLIYLLIAAIIVFSGCKKNIEPVCQFISPQDGAEMYSNIPLTLLINAFDEDGSVNEVRFFIDEVIQKTFTTPPYSAFFESELLTPGTHKLTAYAIDNEGARGETSISIIVKEGDDPGNTLKCAFINPANGEEYNLDGEILVEIEATDDAGEVTEVELYIDDELIKILTETPYKYSIPSGSLSEGFHTLKAIAINNQGTKVVSTIKIKTVVGTESPDFVTFSNGNIPSSWNLQGWQIENTLGQDDMYSIKTVQVGSVVTTIKTFDTNGYMEFHTTTGYYSFDFYIDGNIISSSSFTTEDLGTWIKWSLPINVGTHQFRWESKSGTSIYLDAISFNKVQVPEVNMGSISQEYISTYSLYGTVVNSYFDDIISTGFCWSESPNPTINDNYNHSEHSYENIFHSYMNLEGNKTYYFKAVAENSAGIGYSDEKMFKAPFQVGSQHQGGIIFYVDESGEHGLIMAEEDLNTKYKWYNNLYIVTGATSSDGNENTNKIIEAQGVGNYAANLCAEANIGGYNDWYLPSEFEFNILMEYNYYFMGEANFYDNEYYWTSNEVDNLKARCCKVSYYYNNASFTDDSKSKTFRVRPIRKF